MPFTGSTAALDLSVLKFGAEGSEAIEAPKFVQPWHAQAFGTSIALSRAGMFTWAEWVETLAAVIRDAPERPGEGSNAAYYRQWEQALETILAKKGLLSEADIASAAEDWRRSYIATPHGQPVEFRRNLDDVGDHHDEDGDHHHCQGIHRSEPISVSPKRLAVAD